MAKTLSEKAISLFEGENEIEEKLQAFYSLREKITKDLIEHQQKLQDKASEFQTIIEKINPNA